MAKETGKKVITSNRKAFHEYHIGERFEAGIVLVGTEVKSLRAGRATLSEAYATVDDGEVWLRQAHIPEYAYGTNVNHMAKRNRKLLLNRREIAKIEKQIGNSGRTIVPLSMYFKDGLVKVEIAIGTGKKDWDKRHAIAEREANREAERALAHRNRY